MFLAQICRVVSFAVKTGVMGHFVDLCRGRKHCAVSEMICFHRFCELAFLEEAVSWWQRETEIVYFVNVIDAKLQKAAAILLAGGRPDKTRAGQIRAKTTAAAKAVL